MAQAKPTSPPGGRHGLIGVKLHCPFSCCTQHENTDKTSEFCSKKLLKDHLAEAHADELYKLSDEILKQKGLFVCRECGDYVAQSDSVFLNHLRAKHGKTRNTTNLKIVTKHLFTLVDPVHINHWEEGLEWLRHIDLEEPSFRQSLILKI